MKRYAALVCSAILLVGVPLIWQAWPPVPAPKWHDAVYWADTRGNSGWVYPEQNGDIEIFSFSDEDIQVIVIEYASTSEQPKAENPYVHGNRLVPQSEPKDKWKTK